LASGNLAAFFAATFTEGLGDAGSEAGLAAALVGSVAATFGLIFLAGVLLKKVSSQSQ
jgi:hypothetical protein